MLPTWTQIPRPRRGYIAALLALLMGRLAGLSGTGVFATPSTHSVLTLKEFQQQPFSLALPVVPASMVAAPPKSRSQGTEAHLPTPVLRALYYQS